MESVAGSIDANGMAVIYLHQWEADEYEFVSPVGDGRFVIAMDWDAFAYQLSALNFRGRSMVFPFTLLILPRWAFGIPESEFPCPITPSPPMHDHPTALQRISLSQVFGFEIPL